MCIHRTVYTSQLYTYTYFELAYACRSMRTQTPYTLTQKHKNKVELKFNNLTCIKS